MRDPLKISRYREDAWMVPGHEAAARRLSKNGDYPRPTFTDLDVGFDADTAEEYMNGVLDALMAHAAVKEDHPLREQFRERLFMVMLQLATTAVEADRERRT